MAQGINKVFLIGNLGADPQVHQSSNGIVVSFSLAVSERARNAQTGNWTDITEWVRCVAFGKLAETMQRYLHKGSPVYLEGKLRSSSYEKDGQKLTSTDVVVDGMNMLGGGQNNGGQGGYNQGGYGQNNYGQGGAYGNANNGNAYGGSQPDQNYYGNGNF
ncbi:MAG: single-stranded DNA-binding protein [Succinivibrio sp.]|nr:single-stranded DNA-binding protein [Succinivibrio sp.]